MLAIPLVGPIFIGRIDGDFHDQGDPAISALPGRTLQRMAPLEMEHHVGGQCLTAMNTPKHPCVEADCFRIGTNVALLPL